MTPTRYLALVVLALVLAGRGVGAGTHDDCGVAQTAFGDCMAYVAGVEGKVSPRCCAGLGDIKDLALTAAQRRAVCTCILSEMLSAGKVNSGRAASLPAACDVRIGFIPTSSDFECSRIL